LAFAKAMNSFIDAAGTDECTNSTSGARNSPLRGA
jgi:hypothetical protein